MTAIEIPGYTIRREIGAGGMASVYLALQTSLEREVALKVMAPALAADPAFSKRFLQEARTLASLAHPNIVQVYDVGVTPAQLNYFSMQYLPGEDFAGRVQHGMSETELLRILEGVARALGYAHQRGYVHRDVAPGNILFDAAQTPVLTDFGIARAVSQTTRITSAGFSVGTSHYMSPEQARGGEVDARSDLYSLGVLTWFGLTGKPPYDGADGFAVSYAHVFEPIPHLPSARTHWQDLIDKALSKDPRARFQSADDFIAALNAIRPAAEVAAEAVPEPASAKPPRREPAPAVPAPASPLSAVPVSEPAPSTQPAATVPARATVITAPAQPAVVAETGPKRNWPPLVAAAVGIGLIVLVGWGLLARHTPPPAGSLGAASTVAAHTPPRVAVAPVPAVPASAAPTVQQPAPDTDGLPESPDAAQPLDLASLPTVVDPVVELVRQGRADLAAQRLTSPPGANAFERFSLALRIDARDKAAKQGVLDTAHAYLDLADRAQQAGNLAEFAGYLGKAGDVAGSIPEGRDAVADAKARRQRQIDRLLAGARVAVGKWDRDGAKAAYDQVLLLDPANGEAENGLKQSARIGLPGYVFHDALGDGGNGPDLVVLNPHLAMARHETTRGEFARWWLIAGQSGFAGKQPSCRDRESFFRSSRSRTWQDPGIPQDDSHPVVCVSFAEAVAYAAWLSKETGHRYRLPTPAEWARAAARAPAASCATANLADQSYKSKYDSRDGEDCDDGYAATAPVARFPAVAPGVYDIDGNVREWVAACGKGSPLSAGCREHGIRGRGWLSVPAQEPATFSDSYGEDTALNSLGFRLVRDIEK